VRADLLPHLPDAQFRILTTIPGPNGTIPLIRETSCRWILELSDDLPFVFDLDRPPRLRTMADASENDWHAEINYVADPEPVAKPRYSGFHLAGGARSDPDIGQRERQRREDGVGKLIDLLIATVARYNPAHEAGRLMKHQSAETALVATT